MTRSLTTLSILLTAGILNAQADSIPAEKNFQLSFITPLGTNGSASSKTVNRVSVNLLAGVSKGLNGVELGGLANLVLKDVHGTQFAGLMNYSGGHFYGAAFAGFCNIRKSSAQGIQAAGFCNTSSDSLKGAQFAGFCNSHAGVLQGGQFAGFCNYTKSSTKAVQAAGFINVVSHDQSGAQFAGFGNIVSGKVEGVQVAGFINYAKKVKGMQVGILNIADSVDGASIGLLNIVKSGLHQVEVSGDELFYTNLSLRTGTHKFYNIFSVGATPRSNAFLWSIGYGVGTSLRINDRWRSDITVSAQHVSSGLFYNATSELYKIYVGMEYKLGNRCFIAAGPTLNLYWGDALLADYSGKYAKIAPYALLNETNSNGFNYKGWLGARVAIRFL